MWTRLCFYTLKAVSQTLSSASGWRYQEHRFHLRDSGRQGSAVEHLWRESPPHSPRNRDTPHSPGYDGIGAMLILTRRPAGLRLSLIRISDGLPTLSWPMARKVPVPCALSYIRRYGMYGIYTPRWRENAVDAVTIHYLFLVHMLPSGICFLPCKGTSRQLDGIGFHSEHIGNLPFRAGFESVFPTFSAQTFRMPCG